MAGLLVHARQMQDQDPDAQLIVKTPYFSLKKSDLSIHKLEAMRPFYKWVPRLFSSYSPGGIKLLLDNYRQI